MEFFLPFLVYIVFMAAVISLAVKNQEGKTRKAPVSDDGHAVPKEQDLTCERYGHDHQENTEFGRRYIVHEDPEEGYVILNGIKRKISECKNL